MVGLQQDLVRRHRRPSRPTAETAAALTIIKKTNKKPPKHLIHNLKMIELNYFVKGTPCQSIAAATNLLIGGVAARLPRIHCTKCLTVVPVEINLLL